MKINNLPYHQYLTLEDKSEIDYAIRYGDQFQIPHDHLDIGDFTELPFGTVKDIQYDWEREMRWPKLLEYFAEISGKDLKEIGKMGIVEIYQQKNFFEEQINNINKIESNGLGHIATSDEKEAGIDRFKDFGQYLQLRKLALNDITKIEQIKKMKYKHCFAELVIDKMISDFDKDLSDIRNRRNNP